MSYSWQSTDLPIDKMESLLEARRQELLHILPMEGQIKLYDLEEKLVSEWVLLLEKRDEVVRERVKQENKHLLMGQLQDMKKLLTSVGHFDLTELPSSLHQSMGTLYRELQQFLPEQKLDSSVNKDDDKDSCIDDDTYFSFSESLCSSKSVIDDTFHTPMTITATNPEPPKENLISNSDSADSINAQAKIEKMSTSPNSTLVKNLVSKRIPLRDRHLQKLTPSTSTPKGSPQDVDLRKSLLKSRQTLKSTPGLQRSPGGTPKKKAPRLDLTNNGDLITYALQKKFKNVRKLYASPSGGSPSSKENSFNISID